MNFDTELNDILAAREKRTPFPAPPSTAVIYGAGNRGRELRRLLAERGYRVDRFIDRAARAGTEIDGVASFSPDDPRAKARPNELALLGIWRPDVDLHPIVATLRALGFQHTFTVYDFVEAFGSIIRGSFWQTQSRFYLRHVEDLRRLGALLADRASQECLLDVLRLRLLGDTSVLRSPDTLLPYFPEDLVALPAGARVLDGGAFTGDTYDQIMRRHVALDAYVGLEPDPENFQRLADRVHADAEPRRMQVILLPCAAWSRTCLVNFAATASEESAVSSTGGMTIQAVALDDLFPRFPIHLFKLDIEGAEPDALAGARRLIAQWRPILALAVYHQPGHLWEIPFLLASWDLGYRFYLRYHQMGGNDIVLYGLPGP